jgi:hypothetical protein
MQMKYFYLSQYENKTILKIIKILFGTVCIAISAFWMIFNIRAAKDDQTLWISVLFLAGFGLYQIWAGLGRTIRFIQISDDKIILKKNSILPQKEMIPSEIRKIEVFPLNLIFYFQNGGKTILRFGTSFTDNINPVKHAIEEFASVNKIETETITEEI